MTHHLFGGSNAAVWSQCNAAPYLNALFPQVANENMERGTRIHAYAASLLTDKPLPPMASDEEAVAREYAQAVGAVRPSDLIENYSVKSPLVGGSVDLATFTSEQITIVDLKTGHTYVSPRNNWQLLFYWWLNCDRDDPRSVRLGIWSEIVGDFEWWEPTSDELAFAADLFQKQTTSQPKFVAGPHCARCHVSARCAAAGAPAVDSPIVSDADVAKEFEKIPVYESYIKSLEAQATGLAQEGRLPGYRIGAGRKKAMKWLTMPPDEIGNVSVYQKVPLTPTQVAKLIGKDGESYLMSAALAARPESEQVLIRG